MATEVENRVVSMEFDNKNFEKNMAKTMGTLEEFDDMLNFKGADKGFKTLESAAKKCDLSPLSNAVTSLEMKFSALQVAGVAALSKIVSSAMDAGGRIVKSLTLDPVTTGFAQYETKVQSVQTIMNATSKSIEDVEKVLGKLAIFTDETSYSFGDMVDNIGKFTSNNVELERAASAMQGISNWAAVSGQNSQAASRAMYNLSQALSVGAVTAIDWKSIELANMATTEFKETVIKTAKELGVLDEAGKNAKGNLVNITNFRDTLSDKWFTSDVLLASLEKYNSYSNAVIEIMNETKVDAQTAMEQVDAYIAETGDEVFIFGKKAFKAAQESKTFSDSINATKDAVKTGWQQTFDIIFGNYEEAKELWTGLTSVLWEVFASGASVRNEMLESWKDLGGRADMIDAFSTAFENASAVVGAFKKAITNVFPPMTGERLAAITKAVSTFVKQLSLSEDALKTVTRAVTTLLVPVKIGLNLLEAAGIFLAYFTVKMFRLVDSFLAANSAGGLFNNLMVKIFGEERYLKIAESMNKILTRLGNAFSSLVAHGKNLIGQIKVAEGMHKIWGSIGTVLSPIAGWILDRIVDGFELLANLDFSNLRNLGTDILNGLVGAFQTIFQYVPPVTADIGKFLDKFSKATPQEFFTIIADGFKQLALYWNKFKSNFTISGLAKSINNQFNNLMTVVDGLGDAFVRLVERMNPAKILVSAFGVTLVGTIWSVKRAMEAGTNVLNGFSGVLGAVKKRIEPKTLNPTVKSLLFLAGALTVMALVPADRLRQATYSMIGLMSALTIATGVLSGLSIVIQKLGVKTGAVKQLSITMTYIASAVLILAAAMKVLSSIDLNGIVPRLLILGAIMASLVTVSVIMAKKAKELTKGSVFMIAYATSINLMITALQKLSNVNLSGIQDNLGALIIVIGFLSAIALASSKIKFTSAAGMTTMIFNLILLCGVLKILSKINMRSILEGLVNFLPIIGAISAISLAIRLAGQNGGKIGFSFLALSASILVLVQGIKALAGLNAKEISAGAAAISGMVIVFGLFAVLAKMDKDQKMAKLGSTFIAMSVSMLILSGVIRILGGMDSSIVKQGVNTLTAVMAMFALLIAIGGRSKGSMGAILSMTAAIGALTSSLMLLTLVDQKELLITAAAMSSVFIAFGLAMKNLKSIKLKDALGSIAPIVLIITGLSGAFYVLAQVDTTNAITSAAAISMVLLAIAAMTNIMSTIDGRKYNSYIKTMKLIGIFLAEAVAALAVLSLVNGEGMLEKSASLSLLIVAMTAVSTAISAANIDAKKVAKGAAGIDTVILIIGGMVAAIGALDQYLGGAIGKSLDSGSGVLSKMESLIPIITYFGIVTGILSMLPINVVAAAQAAAAIDVVVGIIGTLVVAVGALNELVGGSLGTFVDSGGEVILKLGSIIGGFIGNIIGGVIGGVSTGALPVVAENLALFSESVKPFIDMAKDYDKSINDNISNFVLAVNDICSAGAIWATSGLDFDKFGADFENFGPHLGNFIKGISDVEFDAAKVDSASNAANAIANILSVLPQEGGVKAAIFGSTDFAGFVTALGKLGPAISTLATDVEGVSPTAFDNAVKALGVVAEFAKNDVPATGGLLQDLIGERNLGVFGEQLESFSEHFVPFAANIENISESTVAQSEIVAKAVGAMAAVKIPNSGGFIDYIIGNNDIDLYGERLANFATQFSLFRLRTANISEDTVVKSEMVAKAVAAMAAVEIPTTGGFLAFLMGDSDLGTFGEHLSTLGESLASYNTNLKDINITKLNTSIDSIKKLAGLAGDLDNFNIYSGANFAAAIKNLSEASIDDFTSTWDSADEKIAEAINITISNVATSLVSDAGMMDAAIAMVDGFVDGVSQNEGKISNSGKYLGETFSSSVKETRPRQINAGQQIVSGLSYGISQSLPSLKYTITKMTDTLINTTEANLQIASPSKRFEKIGMYVVAGLERGIMKNENTANDSIVNVSENIYNAVTDYFDINSPSVRMMEVGKYIVQGIGEGIESDMSAEEKATKKAENIAKAFSDAAALQSEKFKQNNLLYEIWQLEHRMATDEEKINAERRQRQEDLTEAIQEYRDAVAQVAALEKAGVSTSSKEYLEADNARLEARKEMVSQANGLVDFENSAVDAAREQAKTLDELNAKSRDLAYSRWELTHKNATEEEKSNKKEELAREKLNDQTREYNRLVDAANDLLLQGADINGTEYLTALNAVDEQYNSMLETGQEINDLIKERANMTKKETDPLAEAWKVYYDYLTDPDIQRIIQEGAPGFADTVEARLEQFDKMAKAEAGLTAEGELVLKDKPLEEYIDEAGLHKLKDGIELEIRPVVNLDQQTQDVLSKFGFDEDFSADISILNPTVSYNKASSAGRASVKGYVDGATNEIQSTTEGTSLLGGFSEWWSNNKTNMEIEAAGAESGEYMIGGILGAFENKTSGLVDGAKKLYEDKINKPFRDEAEIQSPSKRMIENGEYIIEGLIVGIQNKEGLLYDRIRAMCISMMDIVKTELKSESSSVSPVMSDFTSPVIRPVWDMDDLKRGAMQAKKLIDNTFSSTPFKTSISIADKTAQEISKQRRQNEAVSSQNKSYDQTSSMVFNQTINSPKPLSRTDIYRDTNALLMRGKHVVIKKHNQ